MRLPSMMTMFLVLFFGPIAGIVFRYKYNKTNDRQMATFLWYVSWLSLLVGVICAGFYYPEYFDMPY